MHEEVAFWGKQKSIPLPASLKRFGDMAARFNGVLFAYAPNRVYFWFGSDRDREAFRRKHKRDFEGRYLYGADRRFYDLMDATKLSKPMTDAILWGEISETLACKHRYAKAAVAGIKVNDVDFSSGQEPDDDDFITTMMVNFTVTEPLLSKLLGVQSRVLDKRLSDLKKGKMQRGIVPALFDSKVGDAALKVLRPSIIGLLVEHFDANVRVGPRDISWDVDSDWQNYLVKDKAIVFEVEVEVMGKSAANASTRRDVIASLLHAKRPDLANTVARIVTAKEAPPPLKSKTGMRLREDLGDFPQFANFTDDAWTHFGNHVKKYADTRVVFTGALQTLLSHAFRKGKALPMTWDYGTRWVPKSTFAMKTQYNDRYLYWLQDAGIVEKTTMKAKEALKVQHTKRDAAVAKEEPNKQVDVFIAGENLPGIVALLTKYGAKMSAQGSARKTNRSKVRRMRS